MPRLSRRDRVLSPPVARALTSPVAILLAGAGAAASILVGLPLAAAAGVGALAWFVRVAVAVPRNPSGPRIEPGSLRVPWQGFVRDALQARSQFATATGRVRSGPLRERLDAIDDGLQSGVQECWKVAQAGHELAVARSQIDVPDITAQRGAIDPAAAAVSDSPAAETVAALDAQLAAAARMDQVIADTAARLRLLDARLDEAVTRAIELSVHADGADELRGLGDDVATLVDDLESLRQGLAELDGTPPSPPPPPAAL
jgi:type IV secretory pathway TrbD component